MTPRAPLPTSPCALRKGRRNAAAIHKREEAQLSGITRCADFWLRNTLRSRCPIDIERLRQRFILPLCRRGFDPADARQCGGIGTHRQTAAVAKNTTRTRSIDGPGSRRVHEHHFGLEQLHGSLLGQGWLNSHGGMRSRPTSPVARLRGIARSALHARAGVADTASTPPPYGTAVRRGAWQDIVGKIACGTAWLPGGTSLCRGLPIRALAAANSGLPFSLAHPCVPSSQCLLKASHKLRWQRINLQEFILFSRLFVRFRHGRMIRFRRLTDCDSDAWIRRRWRTLRSCPHLSPRAPQTPRSGRRR